MNVFQQKVSRLRQKRIPWMTKELKKLISHAKFIKRPVTHGQEYRALRNRVTHMTRDCKRQYHST